MSEATYTMLATDIDGVPTGFLDIPAEAKYVRRINGYSEVSGQIVSPSDWGKLRAYTRALKMYRNGVLRMYGQVQDPFVRVPDHHEFIAKDPFASLAYRRVRKLISWSDTAVDDIAWGLIDQANDLHTTHIIQGTLADNKHIDQSYHVGDILSEQIQALSDRDDSFWYRVDPYDAGAAGVYGKFNTFSAFNDKTATVIFAYGQDTFDNCTDYRVEEGLMRNRVTVIGAKGTHPETVNAKASWATHGLWEDERGHMTIKDQDALHRNAEGLIVTSPCLVFGLTPGPDAPAPFTDFDVGDVVTLMISDRGYSFQGQCRIMEFTVNIDPNSGQEILEQIVMEESLSAT